MRRPITAMGRVARSVPPIVIRPLVGRIRRREQQGKLALAAAALPDDRDVLVERDGKADAIENSAAVVFGERQVGDRQLAGERRTLYRAPQAAGADPSCPQVGIAR